MEKLIEEVKACAENVAVSSIIRRYDGKINNDKIINYNNLLQNLCQKHNISYIDNSCIDKHFLNGSYLHLNSSGDSLLGSTYCNYLQSQYASSQAVLRKTFRVPDGNRTHNLNIKIDDISRLVDWQYMSTIYMNQYTNLTFAHHLSLCSSTVRASHQRSEGYRFNSHQGLKRFSERTA